MSTLPPLTPEGLAFSDAFAEPGTWRDADGRTLLEAVLHTLGPVDGPMLWQQAEALFESRHLGDGHRGLPLAMKSRQHRNATRGLRVVIGPRSTRGPR